MEAAEGMEGVNWSKYQLAFFDDVAKGLGNTVVEAVAGSGKSTTLMHGLQYLPSRSSNVLVTSFSNVCVDDLKAKSDKSTWLGPDVRTLNSHGYRACREEFGQLEVDKNRVFTVLDNLLGDPPKEKSKRVTLNGFQYRVKSVVDLAKNFLANKPEEMVKLADDFEIGTEVPDFMVEYLDGEFGGHAEGELFARVVLAAMEECKKPTGGKVDFNDQIWLPAVLQLNLAKYSHIFIDEAQDLCPAQLDMVFRSVRKDGRLTAIGCDDQAIYAWRGAGIGMQPFTDRGQAKILPLSISYRCPKAVVREAQKIVSHIETSPNAIEGHVDTVRADTLVGRAKPGDAILSRKNSPLVRIFFEFIRRDIPVSIQGRDLGGALLSLLVESRAKSVGDLRDYVQDWARAEIALRQERFPNCNTDSITDRARSMDIVCDLSPSIVDVKRNIERLIPSGKRRVEREVILSSVHRSKGLEWDRVFLIESSFTTSEHFWRAKCPEPDSTKSIEWAQERAAEVIATEREEKNIRYVAISRSRRELYYAI